MNIFSIFRRKRKEEQDFSSVLNAARSEYWASNQRQFDINVSNLPDYKERYEVLKRLGLDSAADTVELKRMITKTEELKRLKQRAGKTNAFTCDIDRRIKGINRYVKIGSDNRLITYDDFNRITNQFGLSAFPICFYCGEIVTAIRCSLQEINSTISACNSQNLLNRIKEDDNRPVFVRGIKFCSDIFTHHFISKSEKKLICEYIDRHHRILIPRQSYSTIEDQWISRDLDLNHMLEETGVKLSVVNRNFYITGMGLTFWDIFIACSSEFMNLSDSDKIVQNIPERGFLFQYTPYGVLVWFSFDNDSLKEV